MRSVSSVRAITHRARQLVERQIALICRTGKPLGGYPTDALAAAHVHPVTAAGVAAGTLPSLSKKAMPQPSAWWSVLPPRCENPEKLSVRLAGRWLFIPRSWHILFSVTVRYSGRTGTRQINNPSTNAMPSKKSWS